MSADAPPTLETLLEQGQVASALLLRGDFTAAEVELIHQAYRAGFEHGRAACAAATGEASGNE